MGINKMSKRAQGITEYALVIAVVAVALVAMQAYFKRGVQAVIKTPVDNLGLFGTTHDDLMNYPHYANFVSREAPKQGFDLSNLSASDKEWLRNRYVQDIAIKQEIDPKYGILKSQHAKITVDRSTTTTTFAGSNERKTAINKDEERVEDLTPKTFWQERND